LLQQDQPRFDPILFDHRPVGALDSFQSAADVIGTASGSFEFRTLEKIGLGLFRV
jgi:hypothetical protein